MYDETGTDGRRRHTIAEIAGTFGVSPGVPGLRARTRHQALQ